MPRHVADEGSLAARIVLIGEAPGAYEEAQGRPFVGPSFFQRLRPWWAEVGVQRTDFYITNVYPFRPKNNLIETVSKHEIELYVEKLHDRLAQLSDPWLLVPTGNTALLALTGKKNILKHRGSIYSYTDRRGRSIKVIPTIHPAATFRDPGLERRCKADWARIAGDAQFRELRLPEREHYTTPNEDDLNAFIVQCERHPDLPLAIDLEWNPEDGHILCIGFSLEANFSMTVPLGRGGGWAWPYIERLLALPNEKVLQNGSSDGFMLASRDLTIRNYQWDTLALHHCLDPLDSHTLAYMASIDTRQPYWKDEAKDPEEMQKYVSDFDALLTYNGIDAAVTRELADCYHPRLQREGRLRFYDRHYRRLFQPLLRCMLQGTAVNSRARTLQHTRLQAQCIRLQDRLTELIGHKIYSKKGLSNKKIAEYLYGTLKLPKQVIRKTGKVTTREVTLRRLQLKYPEKCGVVIGTILEHRRKAQLGTFFADSRVDPDGRQRYSLRQTTESGRLSSSKSPRGTGSNIQNIDREARDIFIPNEGCIFLEVDLSQAEDRVVKMLTRAARLIERARMHPADHDEHRMAAGIIFRCVEVAINPLQRYFGKRTRHATNYGMRGYKLSEEVLKDGYVISPEEGDSMIDTLLRADPEILDWQRETRREVLESKCLTNSWGRIIDYSHERMDDELFRSAYAWRPQSEIADLMNQWGLIPLDQAIEESVWYDAGVRIHFTNYDSLLISTPWEEAYDVAWFLKQSLERPRIYAGEPLTIPCEFKLGKTWKASFAFKRLPERKEFDDAAKSLV